LNLKERQHIAKKKLQQEQQHFLDWAYAQLLSSKKDYVIRNTKANQARKPIVGKAVPLARAWAMKFCSPLAKTSRRYLMALALR
jgi:hypothetical protein